MASKDAMEHASTEKCGICGAAMQPTGRMRTVPADDADYGTLIRAEPEYACGQCGRKAYVVCRRTDADQNSSKTRMSDSQR